MTGKTGKCLFIFFFLLTFFSCLLSFTASGFTKSASAFSLDAKPDAEGNYNYFIPGSGYAAPDYTAHKLWRRDDTPGFIFRRGFRLEWEALSALESADYEISFLTAPGEGLTVSQKKSVLSIALFASGVSAAQAGNTYSGITVSKRTCFSFETRGQSFILGVDGEIVAQLPLNTFAAPEDETAALIFINKALFMTDSVKIVTLCQGEEIYGEKDGEEPGDKNGPDDTEEPGDKNVPEDTEEPGNKNGPDDTEEPGDKNGPDDIEKPGDKNVPEDTEEPGNKNGPEDTEEPGDKNGPEDTEEPGDKNGPEDTEEPGDKNGPEEPEPLTVFFDEKNEYRVGSGVDLVILVESSGVGKVVIKRGGRPLQEDFQGGVTPYEITLKADYLEAVYILEGNGEPQYNARFNIWYNDTVEKILIVVIIKPSEEPGGNTEEPIEPGEPFEPPEEPVEPAEPIESPEEPVEPPEPGEPPEEPVEPPEEPGGNTEEPGGNPGGSDTGTPFYQPSGAGWDLVSRNGGKAGMRLGSGAGKEPEITAPAVFALAGGSLLMTSAFLFFFLFGKEKEPGKKHIDNKL